MLRSRRFQAPDKAEMKEIYAISRVSLAMIWFYHGLIPKLLFASPQEVRMNNELIPFLSEKAALSITGGMEVLYALSLLVFYKSKVLLYPSMAFIVIATVSLFVKFPDLFQDAFNPFSINLAVIALSVINLMAAPGKVGPEPQGNI